MKTIMGLLVLGLITIAKGDGEIQPNQIDTSHGFQFSCVAFASLGVEIPGTLKCCSNCAPTNPCTGGGNGALAFRDFVNTWYCN